MRRLVIACCLVVSAAASAQTIPPKGTASTFEVATWNVEWFGSPSNGPTNEATQLRNVARIIRQSAIDVWALQEVTSPAVFQSLLDSLGTGFVGSLATTPSFTDAQRVAFVYRTETVQRLQVGHVLAADASDFGGRPPYQMKVRVTLPDTSVALTILTMHAKAGSTLDDYERRVAAAGHLKTYLDGRIALGEHVILLGDLNDEMGRSIAGGRTTPYADFLADPDYVVATLAMDQGNVPTYCGSSSGCTSGSTLDHIFYSAPIGTGFEDGSTNRYSEVLAFSGFTSNTSDHLPVYARFDFVAPVAAEDGAVATVGHLAAPYPNPAREAVTVAYTLDRPASVDLAVFDVLGRRVAEGASGLAAAGTHTVRVETGALAPGLYLVRLRADGLVQTQRLTVL